MLVPRLPFLWADVARCSGQASARGGPGAPAGPRLGNLRAAMLLRAQLWAQVWAHGDSHTSPSCAHHSKPGLCRHAHGHAQTPGTPVNTHSLLHGKQLPPAPPAVRILYLRRDRSLGNPLLPEPTFPKPVSSTLCSPCTIPFPGGSPIQKHMGCGPAQHAGKGRRPNSLPSLPDSHPSPLLPRDLSHLLSCGSRPTGASRPPP